MTRFLAAALCCVIGSAAAAQEAYLQECTQRNVHAL